MAEVVDQSHLRSALKVKQLYARYQQSRDLINVGAYVIGADKTTDLAVSCQPAIEEFLAQLNDESVSFDESVGALTAILADSLDDYVDNEHHENTSFVSESSSSAIDPMAANNV